MTGNIKILENNIINIFESLIKDSKINKNLDNYRMIGITFSNFFKNIMNEKTLNIILNVEKKIYDKNNIKEIDISKKTDLLVYLIKIMSNLNNENIKFIEKEKIVTKIYNFYEFYIGKAINISELKNTIASFQEKNNKTQSLWEKIRLLLLEEKEIPPETNSSKQNKDKLLEKITETRKIMLLFHPDRYLDEKEKKENQKIFQEYNNKLEELEKMFKDLERKNIIDDIY